MNTSESESLLSACGSATLSDIGHQIAWMFYLVSPNSSSFTKHEDVPNYEIQFIPVFTMILLLEQAVRFWQNKRFSRLPDLILNMGSGFFFLVCRVALLGVVMQLFNFIYNNYRLVDLPPQALSTWIASLLLIEFTYYWIHRGLHEINLLWAAHQFHHNAVDIDVSTTIRDSVVDLLIYEFFPAPLALLIPPPILLVHMQFSLIYQIWLHNEVIGHLGPLEYIINTPRQHRVHHGKNPYCIDKNYGALLMIWDRLFGTYQEEVDGEKIVFGTTSKGYETFDPLTLHWWYYYDVVWRKWTSMGSLSDRLKVAFYGPGWSPGKPRTGLLEDIPAIDPQATYTRYDCETPFWASFYVLAHSSMIGIGVYILADHPLIRHSPLNALFIMLYLLFALTAFGTLFDRRPIAPLVEALRCLLYFPFEAYTLVPWIRDSAPSPQMDTFLGGALWAVRAVHLGSLLFWLILGPYCLNAGGGTHLFSLFSSYKKGKPEQQYLKGDIPYTGFEALPVNKRTPGQIALYLVFIAIGLPFFISVVGLRHQECSQLLQATFPLSTGVIV